MTGNTAEQNGAAPRARDLGLPFKGSTGFYNAITDVPGVQVGYTTLNNDMAANDPPAIRTGVTALLPRAANRTLEPVLAGVSSFNGNGEMTGTHWISEAGFFRGPVVITNTHSVGISHQACLRWMIQQPQYDPLKLPWLMPVVAETCDAYLNDMNGFHVHEEHVLAALNNATTGPVEEGNVGGGTGMCCYDFKGGSGTSSRVIHIDAQSYTVGVFVQANFGIQKDLTILGQRVGEAAGGLKDDARDVGSIIVVVATDAPLSGQQLQRVARRATMGLARTGSPGNNGSGDIFIAFSTQRPGSVGSGHAIETVQQLDAECLDPVFGATVEATEEAIINTLVAAKSMTGHAGVHVRALDHRLLRTLFSGQGH